MEVVFNVAMCMVGAIIGYLIGHFLAKLFYSNEKVEIGKAMCSNCESCKAIAINSARIARPACPLWDNHYTYPETCAYYKPRKEEVEN